MPDSLLEIQKLCFKYPHSSENILKGISLKASSGETICLLGANGCGKTTLIRLLLRFMSPQSGNILIKGRNTKDIPERKLAKCFSYVPQLQTTTFSYSVRDMVLMGRIPFSGCFRPYTKADHKAADDAIERMQLTSLTSKSFMELSGGQRQMVLIARAIAQDAPICLMDEPENGLDYGNQVKLFHHISTLSGGGMTFIITTHHPEHALWLSGRVILMKDGLVMSDGNCDECITQEKLKDIYGINILVNAGKDGSRYCRPSIYA
ncbi:MAG: ABC transporter ATP-binding protein [Victivallales bacterium]|nr:ABC transporter ATP-binding protein [Victivallales bacterium]